MERARAVSLAYIYHYADDGYVCRGVEVPFTLPVIDPETGEPTGRYYGGIIDAILERAGEIWLCDHKTASKVDASYWAELKTNAQLSMYLLACRQSGLKSVKGFLWDVIVKSQTAPKAVTKAAAEEINTTGSYCGIPVSEEIEWKDKETPRLFGVRLFAQYNDDPERFFQRRSIYRTDSDLYEYAEELCDVTARISEAEASKRRLIRNFGACKKFGSLCEFHQICSGEEDDNDSLLYGPRSYDDENRARPASGSISQSKIDTYLTCPRKFQHRYREKIEKLGRNYTSSLGFGSFVHKAIEIFLKHRMVKPIVFPNTIPNQ